MIPIQYTLISREVKWAKRRERKVKILSFFSAIFNTSSECVTRTDSVQHWRCRPSSVSRPNQRRKNTIENSLQCEEKTLNFLHFFVCIFVFWPFCHLRNSESVTRDVLNGKIWLVEIPVKSLVSWKAEKSNGESAICSLLLLLCFLLLRLIWPKTQNTRLILVFFFTVESVTTI